MSRSATASRGEASERNIKQLRQRSEAEHVWRSRELFWSPRKQRGERFFLQAAASLFHLIPRCSPSLSLSHTHTHARSHKLRLDIDSSSGGVAKLGQSVAGSRSEQKMAVRREKKAPRMHLPLRMAAPPPTLRVSCLPRNRQVVIINVV